MSIRVRAGAVLAALVLLFSCAGGAGAAEKVRTGKPTPPEKLSTYTNDTWQFALRYPASWHHSDGADPNAYELTAPDRYAGLSVSVVPNPSGDPYIDLDPGMRAQLVQYFDSISGLSITGTLTFVTHTIHGHRYTVANVAVSDSLSDGRMYLNIISFPGHIFTFGAYVIAHHTAFHFPTPHAKQETAEVQTSLNSIVFS